MPRLQANNNTQGDITRHARQMKHTGIIRSATYTGNTIQSCTHDITRPNTYRLEGYCNTRLCVMILFEEQCTYICTSCYTRSCHTQYVYIVGNQPIFAFLVMVNTKTLTYTHTHTHILAYTHTHTHTNTHTHIQTHTHKHTLILKHIDT